ncbi:MAG: uracil-DNA glycosylase, partial [Acidobacteriota bacterium]|nr:uracil-DNA glycosylase [Acidobacteriota bacterium]
MERLASEHPSAAAGGPPPEHPSCPPARPASERRDALKAVFEQARSCVRCAELAATRRNVVFGAGNADAELMFVGEAPGASE